MTKVFQHTDGRLIVVPTGGTELPAANPATADRYRRGARAILAAVRR